ncbi:penicillin-binding transpeptidase domain-containing protein [Spongisporangium articulatum]|uniref:Penicillin-binding transpeptidase domain-containing protein n=1 Tax=Spongisporangium articulatum TaxID=3362603 RepID=A0ABW8AMJ2_9ACTN
MGKTFWAIISVVVLVVLAAGGGGGYLLLQKRDDDAAARAAADFAHAWQTGGLSTIGYAGGDAATVAKEVQAETAGVTSSAQDRPSAVSAGEITRHGKTATAPLDVTWTLNGGRTWRYTSTVTLQKTGSGWLTAWSPATTHPDLTTGATLSASTTDADRGRILGKGGQVLVAERPVVVVGIQPSRADDLTATAQQVASIVDVNAGDLVKRVKAAKKDAFVQVITLRESAYQAVRDELQPIPGTVFQERTLALAPSADFARALLGSVGPATDEIIKASKGRVQAGQYTGLYGVQRQFDEQLSGTPGLTVTLKPQSGAAKTLYTAKPTAGKDLELTLDAATQKAAEKALTKAKKPAALVAMDTATGAVLAVANGGPNASGYNRALLGQYPPGSTFKVVSGMALLDSGVTPDTPIKCPPSVTVNGKKFSNAEGEVLGTVAFRSDFAHSCNTAFVGSAGKVSTDELAKAARELGYGAKNQMGVQTYTGSVPTSDQPTEHAASMIGQGPVLASPATVAGVSAAIASGTWHAPHLVASTEPSTKDLPASDVKAMRSMMRQVVTGGTATVMRNTPGGAVYGKTGTAEFGSDNPPKTHAWFTGWQGRVAFAVIVEDGGFGAETAAPIAKAFLSDLAG